MGGNFGDDTLAAALINRVLHHCHIVNIRGGNSYGRRHYTEVRKALHPEDCSNARDRELAIHRRTGKTLVTFDASTPPPPGKPPPLEES